MDFVSTALVTLNQPTGFWEKILDFFKSATGTYIVAVILIAVIVRFLFSFVDIINKKVNLKSAKINEKMKPELEAVQKKYGADQRVLQQKQNEIYKKYQFNMMGTCLPMLVTMVLQFVVFLTLWNSLQSVANYNIAEKYENMKSVYVSVIELNDDEMGYSDLKTSLKDAIEGDKKYDFDVAIDFENSVVKITLNVEGEGAVVATKNLEKNLGLDDTYDLLKKYVYAPEETAESQEEDENLEVSQPEESVYVNTGFNEIFKTLAQEAAEKYYLDSQESFLWIKNVYKSDSPTSPLFTKSEIQNYLSKFYSEEEKSFQNSFDYEGAIFDCVVTAGIGQKNLGVNGYYILTILAVVISFLSIWLSNKLMRDKNSPTPQKQSKTMYFVMPIIFGVFTFFYTSLFAVYIIVGQLVTMALTPLVTLIVKKWIEHDNNKQNKKNVVEVDYRRKEK